MNIDTIARKLDRVALAVADKPHTSSVRFAASMPGLDWEFRQANAPEQYFVASITKLVTTTLVFQQITAGNYDLATPASALLPRDVTDGVAGLDHRSSSATVEDLLGHTSGTPDSFETAPRGHTTVLDRLRERDMAWTPEEAIDAVRGQPPVARPGDRKRADYSDTNFQALQLIIERFAGPYALAAQEHVFEPLGMADSFIFGPDDIDRFPRIAPMKNGDELFHRPLAMASFQADGGMVSTTGDQIRFLQAYLGGALFPALLVARATSGWRRMFFPLEYSLGTMRFRLPRAMAPLSPMPPFVGHSGASGAVLFHDATRQLTIAGSVNQLEKRSTAFQAIGRLERALR